MFQIRIGPVTGSTEASTFPGHHELERRTCYDDHKEAEACAAPAAPSARNEREDGPDRFPKNWEQGFGSMYVVPRASRACDASVLERSFSWLADPFLCGRKVWDRPPCSSPVMTKPCLSSVDPWAVWYISHWSKHKSLINNPALIDSLKEKKKWWNELFKLRPRLLSMHLPKSIQNKSLYLVLERSECRARPCQDEKK